MEARDMPNENYLINDMRNKRIALQIDPNPFATEEDEEEIPDSAVSSSSSVFRSPSSPTALRPWSGGDVDGHKLSAAGPHRVRSTTLLGGKNEKEKRKRSRVTPDQLVHLEQFFAVDRSPTAARRREISELLGMQERQTQIWFQNRRAKAKLLDGKHRATATSPETPPDHPPELSAGFEAELHQLIHEEEPVTIIPCTDLSIGSWRRIATTVGKHDLVAYVCDSKKCLTWFIYSDGYGFKMEIPFDTIMNMEFSNAAPGSGLASFFLSQPPLFYLEAPTQSQADGTVTRQWKRCADWTEGQQATNVLHHELIGSAVQLAHLLRNLRANNPSTDIHLHSLSYHRPIDVPMALHHSRTDVDQRLHRHARRRSCSGPPVSRHSQQNVGNFPSLDVSVRDVLAQGPASAVFPSHSFSQMQTQAQASSNPQFTPAIFDQFSAIQTGNQLVSPHHFEEAGMPQYPTDALRRRSSTVHLSSYTHTPSPTISAPVPISHAQALGSTAHMISDLSAVSFKAEKGLLLHEDMVDQSDTVRADPTFDIQSQDRPMFQ